MIEGHGDDIYRYKRPIISNFSSNVCYAADLSGLREHLYDRFPAVCNYPEPEPFLLERKLAGQHNLPEGSVCVTNGATEAIYLIAQTFRETETAILAPAFSEYADACRMHAHRVSFIYEPESIAANIRMAWICNPNNPTGTVYDIDRLRKLIHRHPQVCFVIDQAYGYFTEKEVFTAEEAASYPNVLLLHSMTKQYAIPGLRLGYITANAGLLRRLRSNRMPWSVNRLAIEAGLYILEKGVPCPLTVSDYLQECRRLKQM